jgi:bifunctional non-homologous end joining protein LigD
MGRGLSEYRKKRDFAKTPEPAPGKGRKPTPKGGKPFFMVHRHDARRLHYDLRLEMEGALASWAVPKGPSLDPADRRLAVQTEDHPIEYGDFEGRIPDDEYGGGDSLIWDRGTWDTDPPGQGPAMRARGRMTFVLDGEKLKGRFHLVRTRGAEGGKASWLLFKANDAEARQGVDIVTARPESVKSGRRLTRGPVSNKALDAPHPDPITLLLRVWPPGRAPKVPRGAVRALTAISGGRVALQTAEGRDLAAKHPALARALGEVIVPEAVLDGWISGRKLVAADLLWLDGDDLRPRPADERRDLLVSVLSNPPRGLSVAPATSRRTARPASARGRARKSRRAA